MRDSTLWDHLVIVRQLPDFALGKLDEASMRRVSRHLGDCAACRAQLSTAINLLGALSVTPPPRAEVRSAILQRALAETPATRIVHARARTLAESRGTDALHQRPFPGMRSYGDAFCEVNVPGWALAATAAAILLLGGLIGWGWDQRNNSPIVADTPISLTDADTTAYLLDDSDLTVTATGVVFAEPQGREVYLVADGLPVLPADQRYQVWLFTTDDKQQSAGLLTVGDGGDIRARLETSAPFAHYVGMALTAEPATGSAVPTSDLVLGGSFPQAVAALPPLSS
jgi:anti-sigma-K factor RskA